MSAEGGSRTRTPLQAEDFESSASTSFTTPAWSGNIKNCKTMSMILVKYTRNLNSRR